MREPDPAIVGHSRHTPDAQTPIASRRPAMTPFIHFVAIDCFCINDAGDTFKPRASGCASGAGAEAPDEGGRAGQLWALRAHTQSTARPGTAGDQCAVCLGNAPSPGLHPAQHLLLLQGSLRAHFSKSLIAGSRQELACCLCWLPLTTWRVAYHMALR